MPKKLPRVRDHADIVPAHTNIVAIADMDPRTALVLGSAHVAHGVVNAGAQVGAAAVEAAGKVLSSALESFSNCCVAYMGYLREKEITGRVLGVEREITARVLGAEEEATERVRLWAATVIAEACERTEQLRIHAGVVLETIRDNQNRRESKLAVIAAFMQDYTRWSDVLQRVLADRSNPMSLQDRQTHQQHIDALLQRARDLERTISGIAVSL